MHPLFIDGVRRPRERWVPEGPNGNGDEFPGSRKHVVDGRTALTAKVEMDLTAGVTDTHVFLGFAADGHRRAWKACLGTEDTTCAPLACQAVTDRNTDWVAISGDCELSARAGGCVHDSSLCRLPVEFSGGPPAWSIDLSGACVVDAILHGFNQDGNIYILQLPEPDAVASHTGLANPTSKFYISKTIP